MMNYYDEGGYYPTGGSDKIAEALIPVIEAAGGRVLTQVSDAVGTCFMVN